MTSQLKRAMSKKAKGAKVNSIESLGLNQSQKSYDLAQGSPQWHTHRAQYFNASDAPAMLDLSDSLEPRARLINRLAFGDEKAHANEWQRQRMEDGHDFEARARPLADEQFGLDLSPGVFTRGKLSASVDGVDLVTGEVWEHKSMNADLRAAFQLAALTGNPFRAMPRLQAQAEHIMLVCGQAHCYFTASRWAGEACEEMAHAVIHSDPDMRRRIIEGWAKLDRDIELARANGPKIAPPELVARRIEKLPALRIETAPGKLLASNLDAFKANAFAVIADLPSVLRTEQDFKDGAESVKYLASVEKSCKEAKERLYTGDLEAIAKMLDDVEAEARAKRLKLAKQVEDNRLQLRHELITQAAKAFAEAVNSLSQSEKVRAILAVERDPDWAFAIKGKSAQESMQSALTALLDETLRQRERLAETLHTNLETLSEYPAELSRDWRELIRRDRDFVALELKRRSDEVEAKRLADIELTKYELALEAESERVKETSESVKATSDADLFAELMPKTFAAAEAFANQAALPRLALGEINQRLAPITITGTGLTALGINPVATEGVKKLYEASDFSRICDALAGVIQRARK